MKVSSLRVFVLFAVAVAVALPTVSSADMVTEWNQKKLGRGQGRPGI